LRKRRRQLPHIEQDGQTCFITFTRRREVAVNLTDAAIGPIIIGALRHFAGSRYQLYDYTVMPDHVHVILQPLCKDGESEPLERILHSIKSWTANQINRQLGRSGSLWMQDSHDHMLRGPRDYETKARYIWHNPQAAGLIADPAQWPWSGHGENESNEN